MGSIHNTMQLLDKMKKKGVFIIVMVKTLSLINPRDSYQIQRGHERGKSWGVL